MAVTVLSPPSPKRHGRAGRIVALVAGLAVVASGGVAGGFALARHAASDADGGATVAAPVRTPPIGFDAEATAAEALPAVVNVDVAAGDQGGAAATGMIISTTGLVLTNAHVVRGATGMAVQMGDTARWYEATIAAVDDTEDVALLQLTGASGLPTVPLGRSSTLGVGSPVAIVGNTLGLGGTPDVTPGVVTALDQSIGASDADGTHHISFDGMIEVAALIQEGDSGGPLLDAAGDVVGMTTARSNDGGPEACYAIPIDTVMRIARHIGQGAGISAVVQRATFILASVAVPVVGEPRRICLPTPGWGCGSRRSAASSHRCH